MTITENIVRDVQDLSLREQVEVARRVHRMGASARELRDDALTRTHGALADGADGVAFEQAMKDARRQEEHG